MPRVSRAQTERNRLAIEDAAARLLREDGIAGASVGDVMAAAGLTHGGFYGHFASKDALVGRGCARAFEQSLERWQRLVAGMTSPAHARAALVDGYLTPKTRNAAGTGCPMAGLANDVAREPSGKPVRLSYVKGVKALLAMQAGLQASGDPGVDRTQAMAQMATMVGAMVLARATRGDAMSGEWLSAARTHLHGKNE